ncbi:MAG: hypothetical protein ABJB97_00205 [Acidobacteriota bacterium]
MLRITTDITEHAVTFILEGRLTGIWVSELERCWHTVWAARPRQPICVDMRALTFVDAAGKQLLTNMYGRGADLVASGCFMNRVVEDIYTGKAGPPLTQGTRQAQAKRTKR